MLACTVFKRASIAAVIFSLVQAVGFSATLTHRYSFDSDANDVVGSANGTLQGNATVANGALVLDGTNSSMQLPNDLLTNYDSVTIEMWFADQTVSSSTAQLYTFSGTNGGLNYLLFGESLYFVGSSSNVVVLPVPAVGKTNHVVWTQDATTHTGRLYVNAALVGENTNFTFTPAMIGSTTTNYIGRGRTNSTLVDFKGTIQEFRIFQGALTPAEVAVSDAFGANQPQTSPGTLQTVRLVPPSQTGPGALVRATVFADFSNVTNVNISTQPDLVLSSDNTNVIAVASDQRLLTKGVGTANISAIWQNVTNTLPITVVVPPDVALIHRYTFNEQTNDWIVHDSVGDAHGRVFSPLVNNGLSTIPGAAFMGNGELKLVGATYSGTSGYVALPPGIISSLSEVSIEAWVTWTPGNISLSYLSGAWQRIFDFGCQASGRGMSYLFVTPATDNVSFTTDYLLHAAITTNQNTAETPRLNWTNRLTTNVLACVAVTYSPRKGVMKMYLNGVPVASGPATLPLSGIVDTNCWLGRSQFANDAYFFGRYNEFRIYSGLLSDADVRADFLGGVTNVGVDFQLHNFSVTNSLMITWGDSATNLELFSSPVLGPASVWTAVDVLPVLQNQRYRATVPMTNDAAYFRLQTP